MSFFKCRSNSIPYLPAQTACISPSIFNIPPNPIIAFSPLSSLISCHWDALWLFGLHPIGHFSFLVGPKVSLSHSLPRCYVSCLKFFLHLKPGVHWFNLWISTRWWLWKAFPDTQVLVREEAPVEVLKASAWYLSLGWCPWKQELCVSFSQHSISRNGFHAS